MAFYKDVKGKTRREKQAVAQNRGGFDDEGSHYTGKYSFGKAGVSRNGEGKRYHDGSRSDERRFDGERKSYGDHRNNDRKPYGGDHRSESGKRYGSARPGQERRFDGDRRDGRSEGRKPQQGEYRFSKNAPRYEERGRNVTPASYDEQRKARRSGEESGYNKFRYAAPATYQPAPAVETEPDVVPNENLLSGRNPIREALKMLMRDDLVEIRDGVGTFVKSATQKDIEDAYAVRQALEVLAARTAIGAFSSEELDALEARFRSLQVRLEQGETVRVEEFADADWALHDQILQKSGNRYAQKATNDLRAVLRRYQYLSVRLLSRVEESLTEHLAILDCIRRRDLARLTELLENHIQY